MSIRTIKSKNLVWHDITEVNDEAMSFLKKGFHFHPLDLKDVRSESERAKVDVYKQYVFIIFHYPELDKKTQVIKTSELNVFMGDGYLITIQKNRIKPIKDKFFQSLNNSKLKADYFSNNSWYLLYKLLDSFYGSIYGITDTIRKEIKRLEQDIFNFEHPQKSLIQLAIVKRNILALKSILTPQSLNMSVLEHTDMPFYSEDVQVYFDDNLDTIERLSVILDSYKDSVQGLYQSNESMISLITNRTINFLTMISVSLMPLTLLAGIYGMNIELPFNQQPSIIWMMYLILIGISLFVVVYLYRKGRL